MLYIKIRRETAVIGAEAHETPVYIHHPYYSEIPLRCDESEAQGIVSLDQKEIYHLTGKAALPDDYLEAEIITKEEYDYLVEQMDFPEDDPEPEPSPDEGDSDIMTPQQMRERIIALEQEKDMLIECVLEMSEYVYG